MSSNQLNDISKVYMEAVYGGGKKEEKDTRMVVTNADKKANTPAYQAYKAGKTSVKTGKPLYKAADHLKDNYEFARHKASIISRGGRLEDAVESWNQKLAYREAMKEVSEKKEVNVKDTYKTVAAIVDYDRSKKGSEDATWDSEHGKKKAAKKEKDYAAWERGKMKKDDPNWKHKKYHTGMHGESYETTKTKEVMGALKKRDLKQDEKKKIAADIVKRKGDTSKSDDRYAYEEKRWQDDDGDGKWYEKSDVDGKISKREKKSKKHNCASKVKSEEYGIGTPVKGMHDLDENGKVAHYDVMFEHGVEKNVPVSSLQILEGSMHEHVIHEKMAAKDYDGDGKVESSKDEYFGSKDKAIKKAMGKKVKEGFSSWRNDISEVVDEPESKAMKKVKETNVKNKVVIDPEVKLEQALGGQVEVLEGHGGEKNCGCGQDPCVTYGKGGKMEKENKIKEEILWDRVAEALDELGEMNDVQFKVSPMTEEEIIELEWDLFDENYQAMRNPEKAEKEDKRSSREKRMADPEKGINSPAFKKFMRDNGYG